MTHTASAGRVAVVVGSTRPARICAGIAGWIRDTAAAGSRLDYVLLDLAEVDLPMLDEPLMAALGGYEHPHTRAWSERVTGFDGFVFVFPQYNWGYPGVLKNALDFLYREWADKPVSYATYGTHGGARGARQLSEVLSGLRMRELADHLEITITREDVDEAWQLRDLEGLLRPYAERVRRIDAEMVAALAG